MGVSAWFKVPPEHGRGLAVGVLMAGDLGGAIDVCKVRCEVDVSITYSVLGKGELGEVVALHHEDIPVGVSESLLSVVSGRCRSSQ